MLHLCFLRCSPAVWDVSSFFTDAMADYSKACFWQLQFKCSGLFKQCRVLVSRDRQCTVQWAISLKSLLKLSTEDQHLLFKMGPKYERRDLNRVKMSSPKALNLICYRLWKKTKLDCIDLELCCMKISLTNWRKGWFLLFIFQMEHCSLPWNETFSAQIKNNSNYVKAVCLSMVAWLNAL